MTLTMIRNLAVALLLGAAVGLMPQGAGAHAGHDHGVKAKKVKKSKPKKAAVNSGASHGGYEPAGGAWREPDGLAAGAAKYANVSIGLTTC